MLDYSAGLMSYFFSVRSTEWTTLTVVDILSRVNEVTQAVHLDMRKNVLVATSMM